MLIRTISHFISCVSCDSANSTIRQVKDQVLFSDPKIFFINPLLNTPKNLLSHPKASHLFKSSQVYDLNHLFYECHQCGHENHYAALSIKSPSFLNEERFIDNLQEGPDVEKKLFTSSLLDTLGFMIQVGDLFNRYFIQIIDNEFRHSHSGCELPLNDELFDQILSYDGYNISAG